MRFQNVILALLASMAFPGGVAMAAPAGSGADPLVALGTPVPPAQLQAARARGELVVSAASTGNVGNNSVGAGNVTGGIVNSQSIESNSGFTTVLQNTGNNALLQNSTSINVSLK